MVMAAPLITLLSDFGLKDPYVAEMKAVILTLCPEARIIDISHFIEKFNVRMGAFVLASAARYFPKGTIHVAVVDPDVGTRRHAVLAETRHAFYIGPDNGLLILAAQREKTKHVYSINNPKLMLPEVSSTFHGRDVFAPAAAYLATGMPPASFGPEIKNYVVPRFAIASQRAGKVVGEILYIDDFGNIITNIAGSDWKKAGFKPEERLSIHVRKKSFIANSCCTYGDAAPKYVLVLIGSRDFVEIAVNQGRAAKTLGVKIGDPVEISLA